MSILTSLTSYKAKKAQIKALETELDAMKKDIIAYMGDKERITCNPFIVINENRNKAGIDTEKLRTLFPDVYEQVKTETSYKYFQVK